jgi:dTMP kinase
MRYRVGFDIELNKNFYKGKYIAIEGVDGSGKSTQTAKLSEYFRSQGKKIIHIREPRKEGIIGDIIQKVLIGEIKLSTVAIQYLFSTDRVLNQEEVIVPNLKKGNIVISDRCFWSAIVYGILDKTRGQYNLKEADHILIAHSILSMYHQFIVPDYTFYLKVPLNTAISRIEKKDDAKEIYEDKEKIEKVIQGYNWLSTKFAKEIVTIDGERPVKKVTEEIISKIKI